MGDCCSKKIEIAQNGFLEIRDPTLISLIQEIRAANQDSMAKAKSIKQKNGAIYRGIVDDRGRKQQYGQLYAGDHAFFGSFKDDIPSGHGLAIKDNTQYYVGDFYEGEIHGKGRQWSLKHIFEGDFQGGYRRKGHLETAEIKYYGSFLQNKFHGLGRLTFINGDIYEGQFVRGKFQGVGLLTYASKNVYEGDFKDGKYHGAGKYTRANGKVYQGQYYQGKRVKKGMEDKSVRNRLATEITGGQDEECEFGQIFQRHRNRKVTKRGDGNLFMF